MEATAERIKALEERLTQHEVVQQREIQQAKETVEHSRMEMDRRLAEMNEFRAQLSNERATYVTRDMLDARLMAVASRLEMLERSWSNMSGRLWSMGVGLGAVVILLNIAIRFIWK